MVTERYPLSSTMMAGLAEVSYGGKSPTPDQISYTPQAVGQEFSTDRAVDTYSYRRHEDVSMFFEEVMMHYHFGIERDIAITNVPEVQDPYASDYIVAWGQRNRFADPR